MENKLTGTWDATTFFENLTSTNKLAQSEQFTFCRVSGLEGFEEAVAQMQTVANFVCVSDISDGYTELNNTPRTRRIKTVFLAMRHPVEDMQARAECMEIMRELFRQYMSKLLLEKVKLEQNCIYLDPRISFSEIDRYFFSGCACAYFQIATDVYTDLRFIGDEWLDCEVWLINNKEKIETLSVLMKMLRLGLAATKEIVDNPPQRLWTNLTEKQADDIISEISTLMKKDILSNFKILNYGEKPTST